MGSGKFIAIIAFCLIFSGTVLAQPSIPHQFYGYVTVNQFPADDANIVAKITYNEYVGPVIVASTTTINGNYGFSPSIFYVPDPDSKNLGETIEFFLNGTSVATYTFETGESTRLDLFLGDAPLCGDEICNLDEDGDSCPKDCEIGPVCGDAVCDPEEDSVTCEADCGPVGPFCGDTSCNSDLGETCSTCATDCGACGGGPIGGGPSSGGPSGGGGASSTLGVQIDGSCIDQAIEVTVTNTMGNPAANATVKVLKDMKSVAEEKTGDTGIVSFTFSVEGDYIFYVTKNLYTQNTKSITVSACPEGTTGAGDITTGGGEASENLCANVNCDDQNPCTTEFCVASTGHCSYENQADGIACSGTGECAAGVCEEPEQAQGPSAGVSGPVGFVGLSMGQGAGAGLVIIALIALLAYLFARGKRKGKK